MRRPLRRTGIAVLAVACVLAIAAFLVARFALPARWPADAIHVPRDAETLQRALDSLSSGGTIVIHSQAGEVEGPITINVTDVTIAAVGEVRIRSEGADPTITLRADGVALLGLSISGESVGLRVAGARCRIEDVVVRETPIGIQLLNAQGCELVDLVIAGAQTGVELVSARGNRMEDVTISDADVGVRLLESTANTLQSIAVTDSPTGVAVEQASMGNDVIDCRIDASSGAGIHVRTSNETSILGGQIDGSAIGILLEAATGCEIRNVRIAGGDEAGIMVRQAAQNRLLGNDIDGIAGVGIELAQSAENTLSYNEISDCEKGVALESSDRTLIMANTIRECAYGIRVLASKGCRILRNRTAQTTNIGIHVRGGGDHRLLDNNILPGGAGIALDSSSGNTLLRNRVERQTGTDSELPGWDGSGLSGIAMALVAGSNANHIASNEFADSEIGLLLLDSGRIDAMNNRAVQCEQGFVLLRLAAGVRLEGNRIEDNEVGLSYGEPGIETDSGAVPVIANNVFAGNESVDILNTSGTTLFASGNWWAGQGVRENDSARVSGDVSLEESAWRGTVAVGTEIGIAHEILGRLVQSLLVDAGYRVIDLVGMGDGARVEQAVGARDVDLIWWGASEDSAVPANGEHNRIVEIPAARGWSVVVSAQLAERLPEPKLSALADLAADTGESFRMTAPRAVGHEALQRVLASYGLTDAIGSTDWTETPEEAEALLKFGVASIAVVDNLDETLTMGGFVGLNDDLHSFASVPIAVVVREELVATHPEIGQILADLGTRLTTTAVHDLTRRVRSLHQLPRDVARDFLVQNGLLAE